MVIFQSSGYFPFESARSRVLEASFMESLVTTSNWRLVIGFEPEVSPIGNSGYLNRLCDRPDLSRWISFELDQTLITWKEFIEGELIPFRSVWTPFEPALALWSSWVTRFALHLKVYQKYLMDLVQREVRKVNAGWTITSRLRSGKTQCKIFEIEL